MIFEPTMVPIATASTELITELIATNISGAEVPSATIVKPTNNSLIPKFLLFLRTIPQIFLRHIPVLR